MSDARTGAPRAARVPGRARPGRQPRPVAAGVGGAAADGARRAGAHRAGRRRRPAAVRRRRRRAAPAAGRPATTCRSSRSTPRRPSSSCRRTTWSPWSTRSTPPTWPTRRSSSRSTTRCAGRTRPARPFAGDPVPTTPDAIDLVAAGVGVLVLPQSLGRLHQRRGLTARVVRDAPGSAVGLAWVTDRYDEFTEEFIGIVRGRTATLEPRHRRTRSRPRPRSRSLAPRHRPKARRPVEGQAEAEPAQAAPSVDRREHRDPPDGGWQVRCRSRCACLARSALAGCGGLAVGLAGLLQTLLAGGPARRSRARAPASWAGRPAAPRSRRWSARR